LPDEQRLDGWKRIAAYLNRDVRTVRRWEKNEGLPVRRVMHDKLATVYAYPSELDNWLAARGQHPAGRNSETGSIKKKFAWPRAVVMAVPLLLLGVALLWFLQPEDSQVIDYGEWDWVLITEFENRTDEEVLDGTLEYALQRELANSPYVKVVPPGRVNDALSLMRVPGDTAVDIAVGREISARDGSIRILIGGRIEKVGEQYLLSTELVRPEDGVSVASFTAEASDQDEILSRVGELARNVRTSLGEGFASIEKSQEQLAKVTTPSLQALRLFTQANQMMKAPQRQQAVSVLEEAVRIDPDFASAHLLLVYVLQDRDDMEGAVDHLEKAVALAESTSEQERLFILATYYFYYLDDIDKSLETYALLHSLYPGHPWAGGNLANTYEWLGDYEKALEYRQAVARLSPNNLSSLKEAAELAYVVGDVEAYETFQSRYESIPVEEKSWMGARVRAWPLHRLWIDRNYAELGARLDEIVASTKPEDLLNDGIYYTQLRSMYLATGQVQKFLDLSAMRRQTGWWEALVRFELGDENFLKAYLETAYPSFWHAALLATAGQLNRSQAMIDDPDALDNVPPPFQIRSWKNLARGHLALEQGRLQDAIDLLNDDAYLLSITDKQGYLFNRHSLARAHNEMGDFDQAIRVLQRESGMKPLTIIDLGASWMWLRNQLLLHELLLSSGRGAAAELVAAELRDVLQSADADHPILLKIE
jgi:tetratricopeptide (TPR) repeat protein